MQENQTKKETYDYAWLSPSEEEQTKLILEGKCPHNRGWNDLGHGHNSTCYECVLCKQTKWW